MGFETRSYSGRWMYSKKCLGVDVSRGVMGIFIADVLDALRSRVSGNDFDAVSEGFRNMSTDSRGLSMIFYFPGIPFEGNEAAEEG